MTQRGLILTHLRTGATITPYEALVDYGIMRLAARISDLRYDGYNITTTMRNGKPRMGRPTRYAEYHLTTSE